MSKLEWDKTGERLYHLGVDHGVVFPMAKGKYSTGAPWNGLTAVNESPDGADPNDIYADNIKYASIRSAENFKYTLEALTYPPEFEQCDGSVEVAKGVSIGQQKRCPFGLSYRTRIGADAREGLHHPSGMEQHRFALGQEPRDRERESGRRDLQLGVRHHPDSGDWLQAHCPHDHQLHPHRGCKAQAAGGQDLRHREQ